IFSFSMITTKPSGVSGQFYTFLGLDTTDITDRQRLNNGYAMISGKQVLAYQLSTLIKCGNESTQQTEQQKSYGDGQNSERGANFFSAKILPDKIKILHG